MTTSSLSRRTIRRRLAAVASTCAIAIVAAACNDNPYGLRASLSVQFDTLSAYVLSGTPVTFPSAFDASNQAVVRIGTDVGFDVAFDVASAANSIQLIPARQISAVQNAGTTAATSSRRVGLKRGAAGTFESITRAPTSGYTYDSIMVVAKGEPVIMEVTSAVCQYSLASNIYAKLVIDSINTSTRKLYFRATTDPNCGFRSFNAGVPKN